MECFIMMMLRVLFFFVLPSYNFGCPCVRVENLVFTRVLCSIYMKMEFQPKKREIQDNIKTNKIPFGSYTLCNTFVCYTTPHHTAPILISTSTCIVYKIHSSVHRKKEETHKHTHSGGFCLSKIHSVTGYCIQHIWDFEIGINLKNLPDRTAQHSTFCWSSCDTISNGFSESLQLSGYFSLPVGKK